MSKLHCHLILLFFGPLGGAFFSHTEEIDHPLPLVLDRSWHTPSTVLGTGHNPLWALKVSTGNIP